MAAAFGGRSIARPEVENGPEVVYLLAVQMKSAELTILREEGESCPVMPVSARSGRSR